MTKNKLKKKTVKAYAIVCSMSGEPIESADYFCSNDCCCCDETEALAIFGSKRLAEQKLYNKDKHKIVPVIINFSLPHSKRKV